VECTENLGEIGEIVDDRSAFHDRYRNKQRADGARAQDE
jgi:hypothetical protein